MIPIGTGLAAIRVMRGLTIFDAQEDDRTKGPDAPSISGQAMFGGGQ